MTYGVQSLGKIYLSAVLQKISVSRQATRQRQSENKEKFNKATQHNAIRLLERMGSRVHYHTAARARAQTREMHVQTELKSRGNDHSSPDARAGNPDSTSLVHSVLLFPNIHGLCNYTFDSCLPPNPLKLYAFRSKGQAYLIHAIYPAPNNL